MENKIVENFLELVDIDDVIFTDEYINMVDISVDEDSSFLLSNGLISHNSASSNSRLYRDPQNQGFYLLKGKVANVSKMTQKDILNNKEIVGLMNSIGLELNTKLNFEELRYNEILICCDMDCLEENTKILTEDGIKEIKDITIEDKVLTHSNVYKKVKNVISTEKNSYMSIIVNNDEIICSENHKQLVFRDGEVVEILAKDLLYTDYLLKKK